MVLCLQIRTTLGKDIMDMLLVQNTLSQKKSRKHTVKTSNYLHELYPKILKYIVKTKRYKCCTS